MKSTKLSYILSLKIFYYNVGLIVDNVNMIMAPKEEAVEAAADLPKGTRYCVRYD